MKEGSANDVLPLNNITMTNIEKTLGAIKAMKRKVDSLTIEIDVGDYWTVDVNVGDYWTVEIDVGDFWTFHKSLDTLAEGPREKVLVAELGASMRQIEARGKMDKPQYLKLSKQIDGIIRWLESIKAKA